MPKKSHLIRAQRICTEQTSFLLAAVMQGKRVCGRLDQISCFGNDDELEGAWASLALQNEGEVVADPVAEMEKRYQFEPPETDEFIKAFSCDAEGGIKVRAFAGANVAQQGHTLPSPNSRAEPICLS